MEEVGVEVVACGIEGVEVGVGGRVYHKRGGKERGWRGEGGGACLMSRMRGNSGVCEKGREKSVKGKEIMS